MTGHRSSAFMRSEELSLMMLAELVYTSAFTPVALHASITAAVPSTLTFLNSAWATASALWAAGEAVWMTTSGLASSKTDVSLALSVMSTS
jgi:hypothetical protein